MTAQETPDQPVWDDHSSYLNMALYQVDAIIDQATEELRDVDYDTLVGTGMSGTLVVPIVARALNKYFAIVRKPNVRSHAGTDVEGKIGKRWVFLDDCVASGETRKRVRTAVEGLKNSKWVIDDQNSPWVGHYEYDMIKDKTEFVGSYLYLDRRLELHEDLFRPSLRLQKSLEEQLSRLAEFSFPMPSQIVTPEG